MKTQRQSRRILHGNERLSYAEWCERYRDRTDPLNQGLIFSLPMFEGAGSASLLDVARPHHPVTQVHAPAWTQLSTGLWVMDFDGANDYLSCAAASCTDLDFTSGDFSGCIWGYLDTVSAGSHSLFIRGLYNTDGWWFALWGPAPAYAFFMTNQAAAWQQTNSFPVIGVDTWMLIGWSRSGSSVRVYLNGADATYLAGTHASPVTSARNLAVYGANAVDGKLWNPRIWSRALAPWEHKGLFERERGLLGV